MVTISKENAMLAAALITGGGQIVRPVGICHGHMLENFVSVEIQMGCDVFNTVFGGDSRASAADPMEGVKRDKRWSCSGSGTMHHHSLDPLYSKLNKLGFNP